MRWDFSSRQWWGDHGEGAGESWTAAEYCKMTWWRFWSLNLRKCVHLNPKWPQFFVSSTRSILPGTVYYVCRKLEWVLQHIIPPVTVLQHLACWEIMHCFIQYGDTSVKKQCLHCLTARKLLQEGEDPSQGPRAGSYLIFRNELSGGETYVDRVRDFIGKGTAQAESSRVREPKRTALPHCWKYQVLWWWG